MTKPWQQKEQRMYNPFLKHGMSVWNNSLDLWRTSLDSQSVIAMRGLGSIGLWNVSSDENDMMVREKQIAALKSISDATLATMTGKTPDKIFRAALAPYKVKTRSNAKRLQKNHKNR